VARTLLVLAAATAATAVGTAAGTARAQGIQTNVALPVARGEGIFRSQLRYRRAHDDPSGSGRELDALVAPQTLGYCVTPRFTAFATLPVLAYRRLQAPGGKVQRDSAPGDLRLLGRATLWADDYAPLSTRRFALLGGLELPTGDDGFGSKTWDPLLGAVATWAANRCEVDVDVLYKLRTRRNGFEPGDETRYDLAWRYRVWPSRFAGRLLQLGVLLELNGRHSARSRRGGLPLAASGGDAVYLSPGLQLAARNFVPEASVQVPLLQRLAGPQQEDDFIAVVGVRVPFEVGFDRRPTRRQQPAGRRMPPAHGVSSEVDTGHDLTATAAASFARAALWPFSRPHPLPERHRGLLPCLVPRRAVIGRTRSQPDTSEQYD